MIALSTSQLVRFTPEHRLGDEDAPVFLLRAGSITDRDALEIELASPPYNAGRVWPFQQFAEIERGIAAVWDDAAPEDVAQIHAALAAVRSGEPDAADTALIAQVETVLAERWPPFAAIVKQGIARRIHLPTVAAHNFLRGWENVTTTDGEPLTFATGMDGRVKPELLKALAPVDLLTAGLHAYGLLYADAARPFSPPPSP